jgi:hypothetical protein
MWLLDGVVAPSLRLSTLQLLAKTGHRMILSTHAIVGAALASFLPAHPIGAFIIGFGSHFVLDAIPHWDYPIKSRSVDPKFGAPVVFDSAMWRDALTIGSDAVFGIMIALLVFGSRENFWSVPLERCYLIHFSFCMRAGHTARFKFTSGFIAGRTPTGKSPVSLSASARR